MAKCLASWRYQFRKNAFVSGKIEETIANGKNVFVSASRNYALTNKLSKD